MTYGHSIFPVALGLLFFFSPMYADFSAQVIISRSTPTFPSILDLMKTSPRFSLTYAPTCISLFLKVKKKKKVRKKNGFFHTVCLQSFSFFFFSLSLTTKAKIRENYKVPKIRYKFQGMKYKHTVSNVVFLS